MTMLLSALTIGLIVFTVWRQWMVVRFFRRAQTCPPPQNTPPHLVSILQPILSGDPTLPPTLARGLRLTGLHWQGRTFDVDLGRSQTTVTLLGEHQVQIRACDPGTAVDTLTAETIAPFGQSIQELRIAGSPPLPLPKTENRNRQPAFNTPA